MQKICEGSICRVNKEMLLAAADSEITCSTGHTCFIPIAMIKWLEKEDWRIKLGRYDRCGCHDMNSVSGVCSGWVVPDVALKKEKVFNSLK